MKKHICCNPTLDELRLCLSVSDAFRDTDEFKALPEKQREDFINFTEALANKTEELEKILSGIVTQLGTHEAELKQGIAGLRRVIGRTDKIVETLNMITRVTDIVAKCITFIPK